MGILDLDVCRNPLGYSQAIAGLRAKTLAALLTVAACNAAVGAGLADSRGKPRGPTAMIPVAVRVPVTERVELLAADRLQVRLRLRRRGRVLVAPLLETSAGVTPLGDARFMRLQRRRWTDLSLTLGAAGRAALAQCATGKILIRVSNRRLGRRLTVSRPLRVEAPACSRFFGADAVWNKEIPHDAPLDPRSGAVTAHLLELVDASARSDKPPTINTEAYAPPVYTVPATQPGVRVHLDRGAAFAPELADAFAEVPLPPDAVPAPGTDSELVVWQPATDTLWEFWRLRQEGGRWYATWGGRLDDVSDGPGHFEGERARWGASGSSLPLAGGMITPRELERGEIDHALSMAIPGARAGVFALPAQRTDGESHCEDAPPEGGHFRLDPSLDVDALGLPPAVETLARAAQRYGIYVRDEAGTVAFYAQSSVSMRADPYPALFGGQKPYDLLRSFPWSRLQLLRMDLRSDPHDPQPVLPPLVGC